MTRRVLIATLLALFGSGIACNKSESPSSPTPTANDGPIFYTAIGASDGIGFGSSVPCIPLAPTCPDGKGYVQILTRQLKATGRTFGERNLSLPGSVLSKAIEDLARDVGTPIESVVGNFIERQAPFVPANTTHWFDMGTRPDYVAIRFFHDEDGWVGNFTGDDIATRFEALDQLVAA